MFDNIGNADITSLVNFGMLNNYFKNKKLKVNEIVTQGFLKNGIISRAELLSKNMSFKEKTDLYYRLKRLYTQTTWEKFSKLFLHINQKKFTTGFKYVFSKKLEDKIKLNIVFSRKNGVSKGSMKV